MTSQTVSFPIPSSNTGVSYMYDTFSKAPDSEIFVYNLTYQSKNKACFNVNIAEHFNDKDAGWYAWTADDRLEGINGDLIRLVYKVGESHTSVCSRLHNYTENRNEPFNIVCLMKAVKGITRQQAKLVEKALFTTLLSFPQVNKTRLPSASRDGEYFICSKAEILQAFDDVYQQAQFRRYIKARPFTLGPKTSVVEPKVNDKVMELFLKDGRDRWFLGTIDKKIGNRWTVIWSDGDVNTYNKMEIAKLRINFLKLENMARDGNLGTLSQPYTQSQVL